MPDIAFDHQDPAFVADPYPVFQRLRETAPVFRSERMGAWVVTRHADVRAAFRDPRLSSDRIRPFFGQLKGGMRDLVLPLCENLSLWAVFNDPPQHTRLRALMSKAFTSRAVDGLRPRIAAIVDELLEGMARSGPELDYHREFAYPLPASVIAEMLGVPRADVGKLKKWSDDLAQFVLTSRANPEKYRRAADGMAEMTDYFDAFIRRRAGEAGGSDVTTALLAARERDDRLSHEEIVATALLLLFAGHETTTQLLANGLYWLLRNPAAMADLRAHLDEPPLVENAVEEMLRYDGPSLSMVRVAAEDFTWHGAEIAKGERVFLFQSAANRDPAVFAAPDRFDLRRANAGEHLAFGYGIHFCTGAPLARLEAQVAFPRLLRRFPDLALADPDPPWSDSILTRGMLEMRVRV
ncbi:MAG: cytochrome P450 [Rhodospirillaceae bacterium]|nr:cytochrome P450 [Rhodospirillaceae bacterium]